MLFGLFSPVPGEDPSLTQVLLWCQDLGSRYPHGKLNVQDLFFCKCWWSPNYWFLVFPCHSQYSAVDSNPLSLYVMHPFWNTIVKVRPPPPLSGTTKLQSPSVKLSAEKPCFVCGATNDKGCCLPACPRLTALQSKASTCPLICHMQLSSAV